MQALRFALSLEAKGFDVQEMHEGDWHMIDKAREAFDRLYAEYELSPNDAAWHVFKSGWDARAMFEYELDLQLAELQATNKRLMEQVHVLKNI